MAEISQLSSEAQTRIAAAGDLAALEALRVEYLGKQGSVSALLKTLGAMSPEERQSEGPKIHALREAVSEALAVRKQALEGAALEAQLASEKLDLTLPAPETPRGSAPGAWARADGRASARQRPRSAPARA
jgi:phenylalanyl-tRNA synthetase alpha chain